MDRDRPISPQRNRADKASSTVREEFLGNVPAENPLRQDGAGQLMWDADSFYLVQTTF